MRSDKTKLRRLPERAITDLAEIHSVLDEGFVCHVAYVTEGRPVVIPTLYARDEDRILLHGSKVAGFVQATRDGSPLSVAVTHVDGLVVARSGFNSSANYRSVAVHGVGKVLEGDDQAKALDVTVERLIPGRLKDLRSPTKPELRQTAVVELSLDEVSAKTRSGGPKDYPEDLGTGVWAGVVPFELVAGEPETSADLEDGIPIPEYLTPYRRPKSP